MSLPVPGAAVARWIRRELSAYPPRARSLVVTVWGDTLAPHGGSVWLSTLIGLLAPFGVNERLVRTSVFRLTRDGWLEAHAVGRRARYRLTTDGARRFSQAYRRVYTPPYGPWDGTWEMALVPAAVATTAERARLREDLRWSGYAAVAPGVYARPSRSSAGGGAGVIGWPAGVLRFSARDLPDANGATLARRVDEAWQLPALAIE